MWNEQNVRYYCLLHNAQIAFTYLLIAKSNSKYKIVFMLGGCFGHCSFYNAIQCFVTQLVFLRGSNSFANIQSRNSVRSYSCFNVWSFIHPEKGLHTNLNFLKINISSICSTLKYKKNAIFFRGCQFLNCSTIHEIESPCKKWWPADW